MALGKHSCEGTSHSYLLFMLAAIYTAKSVLQDDFSDRVVFNGLVTGFTQLLRGTEYLEKPGTKSLADMHPWMLSDLQIVNTNGLEVHWSKDGKPDQSQFHKLAYCKMRRQDLATIQRPHMTTSTKYARASGANEYVSMSSQETATPSPSSRGHPHTRATVRGTVGVGYRHVRR